MWVHSFCSISLRAGNFIGWSFKNISHSQYIFVQIHSIWLEDLENFFTPGGVKPTAKVVGTKNVDVDTKNDHSQFSFHCATINISHYFTFCTYILYITLNCLHTLHHK